MSGFRCLRRILAFLCIAGILAAIVMPVSGGMIVCALCAAYLIPAPSACAAPRAGAELIRDFQPPALAAIADRAPPVLPMEAL